MASLQAEQPVLAFNCELQAIKVQCFPYKPQQIIRIRNTPINSKKSGSSMDVFRQDKSGAGESWSPIETATDCIKSDDLVVVVGQYVFWRPDHNSTPDSPQTSSPSRGTSSKGGLKHHSQFRMDEHANRIRDVGLSDTVTVVMKITNKAQRPFYGLCHKKAGLCEVLPLPSVGTNRDRDPYYFYPEWCCDCPQGQNTNKHKFDEWKKRVTAFVNERFQEINPGDSGSIILNRASTKATPPRTNRLRDDAQQAIFDAMGQLALYKITANPECLRRANDAAERMGGRYTEDEERNLLFKSLFHGKLPMGAEDASTLAKTCKKMWSLDDTHDIKPHHLRYLSRGINCFEALETSVPERLYRPLIILFSDAMAQEKFLTYSHNDDVLSNDEDSDGDVIDNNLQDKYDVVVRTEVDDVVDEMIRRSYRLADLCTPKSVVVEVSKDNVIQLSDVTDSFRQFIISFKFVIKNLIQRLDEMMAAEVREFNPGVQTETQFDIQATLREVSCSHDFDHSLTLLMQVAATFCRNSHMIVEDVKDMLNCLLEYLDLTLAWIETGEIFTDEETVG